MTKEEAIKRIKDWNLDDDDMEVLIAAIPELKEKESEDEKIRKEIIAYLDSVYLHKEYRDKTIEGWIAWLKKQGEQKMKTEPKDVIDLPLIDIPFGAKDSELIGATYFIPKGFHAEIEGNKVIFKKGEQKSTWSEEDEVGLGDALWAIEQARTIAKDENDMGNLWYAERWLKSIKERVQPQPKQEWSEEDEMMLECVLDKIGDLGTGEMCKEWLKALKDRITLTNKNDFDRGYEVGVSAAKFNQWKPTKEQMLYLASAIERFDFCDPEHAALEAIYTHFKKL